MFGDLFDTIGGWIDTGVDYVAETVGYIDDYADFDQTEFSAGDQLTSDVLGFIREGAGAYARSKERMGKKSVYQAPSKYRDARFNPRSGYGSGRSKAGSKTYSPTASGRIGYGNPEIQTALTNLLRSSNNSQLNNMFSSYIVQPNRRGNTATVTLGSANLKKITSTKLKTT